MRRRVTAWGKFVVTLLIQCVWRCAQVLGTFESNRRMRIPDIQAACASCTIAKCAVRENSEVQVGNGHQDCWSCVHNRPNILGLSPTLSSNAIPGLYCVPGSRTPLHMTRTWLQWCLCARSNAMGSASHGEYSPGGEPSG